MIEALLGDWHQWVPAPWADALLAALSLFCGAFIGVERERKSKPAGLRTMGLICFGACLFTMLSAHYDNPANRGRIAAQIVSGIGFLGAGVILRGDHGVTGITTAATIWAVAAVGMVAATGYAIAAVFASAAIYVVLMLGIWLESHSIGPCRVTHARVIYEPSGGKVRLWIEDVLDDYRVPQSKRVFARTEDGELGTLDLEYCRAHRVHREFLVRLATGPGIQRIDMDRDV